MLRTADLLRAVLIPFLLGGASLLGMLLVYLVVQRVLREQAWRRRQTLITRYRPAVDEIVHIGPSQQVIDQLRRAPASHRPVVASLLLAPLHAARGDIVSHVRGAAKAIGLIDDWLADLRDRHWWLRAEGVRALGFVEELSAVQPVLRALDDDHPEVRAAAIEAVGRLGDVRAIPLLLGHLADGSRYQRARVVDALRSLGPSVTPALIERAGLYPHEAKLLVEVLGLIGTVAAIDPLLHWCADARSELRVAALEALGSIGIDDRSCAVALGALGDSDPQARAMAARALGRARREEAVVPLAARLDDEWLPAAQAASALQRLGGAGLAALQARVRDQGQAGDLARQMLWAP